MKLTDAATGVIQSAIDGMRASRPRALQRSLEFYGEEHGVTCATRDVIDHLATADPNDGVLLTIATALRHWDFAAAPDWADSTVANTRERREVIYRLLDLDIRSQAILDDAVPVWTASDTPIVIAEDHEPWYNPDAPGPQFYFSAYCRQLLGQGWEPTSIEEMGQVTGSIVERISDPTRSEQYQSKGLVVGYVQSGKTANFTGVLARAADAGYRLFIVLAGTMDILRQQTQRRIDRDLIGRELLEDDYVDDDEWPDGFLSHGAAPAQLGSFDWHRLTGPIEDYQRLRHGIDALEFPKHDPAKPLYDPQNLGKLKARIMVIKKHPAILRRVAHDLSRVKARLADVPALVIDDESDLASVNTRKPTKKEADARTATNKAIVELLTQLPRSQYIGYTATPVANVFIDPADAEDLFPKDFMVSLPRPDGYMGIREFHDIDSDPPGYQSNERAFVRDVRGEDALAGNLPRALDAYILSGALKLFRTTASTAKVFRHHTMLVHVSHLVRDQETMAAEIENLLDEASYHSGKALERLREVWEQDFLPVSAVRANGWAVPGDFSELRTHIGECLRRLEDGKRVLIVNGTRQGDTPDFDRTPIWKVLCGGAKLSRGYTVEGLTVSYYRRKTDAADTLMQMGRWFGFRKGYADLVRLFIGREEPGDRGTTVDLYTAFEAACRDELYFRDQLRRYSKATGPERITPKQVPPLVPAHLLRPTAANKMYNAEIEFENLGGQWREPTLAPKNAGDATENERAMRALLSGARIERRELQVERAVSFEALVVELEATAVLRFLKAYRWLGDARSVQREIEYLSRQHGDPEIRDWLLIAPQVSSAEEPWTAGDAKFASPTRSRTTTGRFGVYSEPRHRPVAEYIARIRPENGDVNASTAELRTARRAVMTFYPVSCPDDAFYTMGFAIQFPENAIPRKIVWKVRDPNHPNAITVDVVTPTGGPHR